MQTKLKLLLSILLTSPILCSQIEISEDESQSGILITPFDTVNIKETVKYLAYSFDVSAIKFVLNWHHNVETVYSTMKTICNQRNNFITPLETEIENIHWNTFKPVKNMTDVKMINGTLFYNAVLNANINQFKDSNNEVSECFHLIKIHRNFQQMNNILNNLAGGNVSVIEETVPWEHYLKHVNQEHIYAARNEYQGLEREDRALIREVKIGNGSMTHLLNTIPFMRVEDENRIIESIRELMSSGKIPKLFIKRIARK